MGLQQRNKIFVTSRASVRLSTADRSLPLPGAERTSPNSSSEKCSKILLLMNSAVFEGTFAHL